MKTAIWLYVGDVKPNRFFECLPKAKCYFSSHLFMAITAYQATKKDTPLLVQMMEEFYAESDYPLDAQWATESFATFLSTKSHGAIFIVSYDGKPAGYAVLTVRFSMEYGGLDAFIDDLFVRPHYRRRGVGQAAIMAVLEECKQRKILALHVEVGGDNVAAKALYEKNGLRLRDDNRQLLTTRLD